MTPLSAHLKSYAPLSAHQKSHDPPQYSTALPPPVEIMNGPLDIDQFPDCTEVLPFLWVLK